MSYLDSLPKELRILLSYYLNHINKQVFLELYKYYRERTDYRSGLTELNDIFSKWNMQTKIDVTRHYDDLTLRLNDGDIFTDKFIKNILRKLIKITYDRTRDLLDACIIGGYRECCYT